MVNTNLNNGQAFFNINSSNTLNLSKNFSAEVIASYKSKQVYGFLSINPIFSMAAGVQQQLWNKKASIKLALADAFYTNRVKALTVSIGYRETFFKAATAA